MSQDLASLDRQIAQFEQNNRWNDALGLLWKRAATVPDAQEKVRTLEHIASVYRVKLNNEGEAIRAAEQVLAIAPGHAGATAFLRDAYTRRHDIAKLHALENQGPQGGSGFLGKVGGAFTAVGAGISTAAGGVFNAVTSAPMAYEHPGSEPAKKPVNVVQPPANRCPFCNANAAAGVRTCGACGASW